MFEYPGSDSSSSGKPLDCQVYWTLFRGNENGEGSVIPPRYILRWESRGKKSHSKKDEIPNPNSIYSYDRRPRHYYAIHIMFIFLLQSLKITLFVWDYCHCLSYFYHKYYNHVILCDIIAIIYILIVISINHVIYIGLLPFSFIFLSIHFILILVSTSTNKVTYLSWVKYFGDDEGRNSQF